MSISRKRGLAGGAQYTVGPRRVKPCCGITGSRFPQGQKYPVTPDYAKIIRSDGNADKIVIIAVSGLWTGPPEPRLQGFPASFYSALRGIKRPARAATDNTRP